MTGPNPAELRVGGRTLRALRGGTASDDVDQAAQLIALMLQADGAILVPHSPEVDAARALAEVAERLDPSRGAEEVLHGVDVILATSGSTTGTGRLVGLSRAALIASATATAQRLGGQGRWVASLPIHHIAGFQVLVRSALAGATPLPQEQFEAGGAGGPAAGPPPRFASLVPTQLRRTLAGPDAAARLAHLDAVLLGGSAIPPALLEQAGGAGVRVVTTYGMTETAGGCVYDGVPLGGVSVRLGSADRVEISGPVLATGYLDASGPPLPLEHGWLTTSDQGRWQEDRLRIVGRADDVIISGGINVAPAEVERHLSAAITAPLVVVGVPDETWGQAVCLLVADPHASPHQLLAAARRDLRGAQAPRIAVVVDQIPTRGIGKPDRRAATELARQAVAAGRRVAIHQSGRA